MTSRPKQTARILVTGFGPFPGVPDNASASLVTSLAGHPELADNGLTVDAVVLPTVWGAATEHFRAAIDAHRPDHVVSFGVSRSAAGFAVETLARNEAAKADATGALPPDAVFANQSRRLAVATLPARRIVKALRAEGHPATRSFNAGRYLCNALLFHGLNKTDTAGSGLFGFVHIPARVACDTLGGVPTRLDWAATVQGGVALLRALSDTARDLEASR